MINNLKNSLGELTSILDSKLITPTISNLYDIKVVKCGDYVQVYNYENKRIRNRKELNSDLNLSKIKINSIFDKKNKSEIDKLDGCMIEQRNIIRSKLECQRIAKSNMQDWCTFITLTFKENLTDIELANKKFRYFIDKIRRAKKDFKYLCIPEFQKRGAVHYHMLCNISYENNELLYVQEDNSLYKHIKYWNYGFSSIEPIKGDFKKVIGYISKYMTKDIDNRLFGHRRYFYSSNLTKPVASYIDTSNSKHFDFYKKIIQDKKLIYQNNYINNYDNTNVTFLELI